MTAFTLLLAAQALAGDCDVNALKREIQDASPQKVGALFVDLAACDADAAGRQADEVMARVLPGEDGNRALIAAIEVGKADAATSWVGGLQSDDRAPAISALGRACIESEPIQSFFIDQAEALGPDFWKQRWYRALGTCRVPAVQGLLSEQMSKGVSGNIGRFFQVLEVFTQNLGPAALPTLERIAQEVDDEESATMVVQSFGEACGLGTPEGVDLKAAEEGIAALLRIAPDLSVRALEQARITVKALGDERASDELAAIRYSSVLRDDGTVLWGTVATETVTCKNGKVNQYVHVAEVTDPGQTWPDQLEEKVDVAVTHQWGFEQAK
ncbi:MAG: hypothetical protein QGG40_18555, partial [Myxococcota bacterium]|nr:hypothetical protein [Myxococcota bacterium]